jgi:hypothetical protein
MSARQETFAMLDKLQDGTEIAGIVLSARLHIKTGGFHYPDTYLRYMREYRQKTGRQIVCISKAKSLYRIEGEV